jgi:hypothetical protein
MENGDFLSLTSSEAETLAGFLMSKGTAPPAGTNDLIAGNVTSGTIFRVSKKGILLSIPGMFGAFTMISGAFSPVAPVALGLGVLLAVKEIRDSVDSLNDEQASIIWAFFLRSRIPEGDPLPSLDASINDERHHRGLSSLVPGRIEAVIEQLTTAGVVMPDPKRGYVLKEWFLVRQA